MSIYVSYCHKCYQQNAPMAIPAPVHSVNITDGAGEPASFFFTCPEHCEQSDDGCVRCKEIKSAVSPEVAAKLNKAIADAEFRISELKDAITTYESEVADAFYNYSREESKFNDAVQRVINVLEDAGLERTFPAFDENVSVLDNAEPELWDRYSDPNNAIDELEEAIASTADIGNGVETCRSLA